MDNDRCVVVLEKIREGDKERRQLNRTKKGGGDRIGHREEEYTS